MAKYTVKHTSIIHNEKVYGEGSIIELDEKQAKRISDFVELIPEKVQDPNTKTQTSTAKSAKSKAETETKDGETSDGGQK